MQRLSLPIEKMKPHYAVVVIGSGYGGSITASRFARAGRDVCVLERGRERIPGEYPDTEAEALREMQVDSKQHNTGNRTGLYDFRLNEDINVFIGCGLGGTSLVNANVVLKPESRVFEDTAWPKALRDDVTVGLEQGFQRAKHMLGATPYPKDKVSLAKFDALMKSGKAMGACASYAPDISVSFKDGLNAAGFPQKACTNCGDCVSGCNVGAKNTVLMNYLPDAVHHGAEIFTCAEVRRLEKNNGRWVVYFQHLETAGEVFDAPTRFVTADHVILGAGSLGSTEILLRSRKAGLSLSDQVGHHFTGNGDVLGFAYNCDENVNGIGWGHRKNMVDDPVGPTISGIIDCRERDPLNEGWVIEEGALPGALANIVPLVFQLAAKAVGKDTDTGVMDLIKEKERELGSLIRGAYHGATRNTQTFLVMTHDSSDGRMVLEDDRLRIQWPGVGNLKVFRKINEILLRATKPLGGTYVPNPIWHEIFQHQLMTVHPLGGCRMAESGKNGVVNHSGQVFAGSQGSDVHKGLYVLDGAIIPRSLGINPLLTISALAERSSGLIADKNGWKIDYSDNADPSVPPVVRKAGIRFTEKMKGYFSLGDLHDYKAAANKGKEQGNSLEFILTIVSQDLDTMFADHQHRASITGTMSAGQLSPEPLVVSGGEFQLFASDPQRTETRVMRYKMQMHDSHGKTWQLAGFKEIRNDSEPDIWSDTTTLYITISEKGGERYQEIGKGVLHIDPVDFVKQLTTMEVFHVDNALERLKYLAKFGEFFSGTLFDTYGGIVARPQIFNQGAPPRKKRVLRVSAPEIHWFSTDDGLKLRLTRYRGGRKGPLILSHGLGVSSKIFSMDTIDTNLLEYLFVHGYDVWLLDYRSSIELATSSTRYTGDEIATKDYPAAVAKVKLITGEDSVQMLVHCFGSTTFFMAMLAGLKGVRSAVCSQVATHVRSPVLTRIKSGLHLPEVLGTLGVDSLTAYVDTHADWQETLFDDILRMHPIEFEERCRSSVCHRITFLYGTLYEHDQLNTATHDNLHEMFGVAAIDALSHLALMVRKGHLVNAQGKDVYLPHLDRLAIPISIIHGAENACYHPKSTEITFEALREANGDLYSRHVIPSYGHIDCIYGKNAVSDVYPLMLAHLEKTN